MGDAPFTAPRDGQVEMSGDTDVWTPKSSLGGEWEAHTGHLPVEAAWVRWKDRRGGINGEGEEGPAHGGELPRRQEEIGPGT